jgi:hypothetical protein
MGADPPGVSQTQIEGNRGEYMLLAIRSQAKGGRRRFHRSVLFCTPTQPLRREQPGRAVSQPAVPSPSVLCLGASASTLVRQSHRLSTSARAGVSGYPPIRPYDLLARGLD